MSQMFRSFEANSGTIQRKGSEDLAKASASAVDSANLGQTPNPPVSEKVHRLPLPAIIHLVLAVLLLSWGGFFTMDFLLSGVFTFPRTSRAITLTFAVIILSYEFIFEEHRTRYSSMTGIPPLKVVLYSCIIPYMVGSLALLMLLP